MNGDGKKPVRPGEPEPAHLIGGWAAGNLTAEEKRRLLEAALGNQKLFDELMAEEPMREMLEDSAARAELMDALQPVPSGWKKIFRPWAWVPAAAAAGAMAGFVIWIMQPQHGREAAVEMAQAKLPEPQSQKAAPPDAGGIAVSPIDPSRIKIVPRSRPEEAAQDKLSAPPAAPPPPPQRLGQRETEEKAVADAVPKPALYGEGVRDERGRALPPVRSNITMEIVEGPKREVAAVERERPRAATVSQPATALEKDVVTLPAPADAMPMSVSWRDASGNWHTLGGSGAVPRGSPVRVSLTASIAGTVVLQERTRRTAPAMPGETVSFELPPFEPGEYDIVVAIAPLRSATSPGIALQMTDAAAAERRKAAGAARQDRSGAAAPPAEQVFSSESARKAEAAKDAVPAAPPKSIRIRVK